MKAKSLTAAALALCLLASVGCGRKKANTPKDAVKDYVNSLLKGDKELFAESVHYADADKEVAEAHFDMLAATVEFATNFKQAYGGGYFKKGKPVVTAEDLDKVRIETIARFPSGEDLRLVRKEGQWYVDLGGGMPRGEAAKKAVSAYGRMARGIKQVTDKIGKEGQDARKLRDEFEAAF